MKKISQSDIIGERGVTLTRSLFLDMGFMFYETGGVEAGIDGIVEVRDPETGAATNLILQVQVKSTERRFVAEDADCFTYLCDADDLQYWLGGNAPVILVLANPAKKEAYWVSVKAFFSTPEKIAARKVFFDKHQDRLEETARNRLIELARPTDSGLYINPLPKRETLISNLLSLERYASRLYSAETKLYKRGQVLAKASELNVQLPYEWILWRGRLWSVHDLSTGVWPKFTDLGTFQGDSMEEWTEADDDTRRHFVQLMNQCLTAKLRRQRIRHDRELGHYHYMIPKHKGELEISYTTHTGRNSPITVVSIYEKKDKSRRYYRHHAFTGRFLLLDGSWYLEITPTYRYTWDGFNVDRYYEDKLSGIKKQEGSRAVLSQVELWADVIARDEPLLGGYPFLHFGRLLNFESPVGINDGEWLQKEDEAVEVIDLPTLFSFHTERVDDL